MLCPMRTSFFKTLEGEVRQVELRTSADGVFWNEDLSDLSRSYAAFVQIFSDKMERSSKSSALAACPMHVVPLKFIKVYNKGRGQSEHS